jgi:mono/diheme cytochrome c family protein
MRKVWKVLGLILTFVVISVVGCKVRRSEPVTGREFTANSERIANGERVYMAKCQKCHPGGEGGLGPSINANPAPSFLKRFQTRHGLGTMPSFPRSEISKKDLHDITAYLKAWKKN